MAAKIQHPANFVSTIYQPSRLIADLVINPANSSAATLNAVRAAVDAATVAVRRRNYPAAIERYKTAQGLAYQLLNPTYKIGQYLGRDALVHPVTQPIEQALAAAGLKLIEGIQPDVTPFTPPVRVDRFALAEDDQRLAPLGFQLSAAGAADQVTLGTTLLAKGRAGEAATVLTEAITAMRADDRADPGLRATALLNLSAAQLAQGDPSTAASTAAEAAEQFTADGDTLGEAQSMHAGGVALQRAGQADRATELLTRATERFAVATAAPGPDGARPVPIDPGFGGGRIGPVFRRADGLGRGALLTSRDGVSLADRLSADLFTDAVTLAAASATPSRELSPAALPSADVTELSFIASADVSQISLRWPTADQSWSSIPVETLGTPVAQRHDWRVGIPVGDAIATVEWQATQPPSPAVLIDSVYAPRLDATVIGDLWWWCDTEATTAAYLAHLYCT